MSRWARAVQLLRTNFLLRCSLLLLALLLPWPGLARFCGSTFSGFASEAADFALSGGPAALEFTPASAHLGAELHAWDVLVSARDESTHALVQTALDLRRTLYLPSAVFLALVLALRLPLRKKVALLAVGLGALQIGPALTLLSFFSGKLPVQAFHLARVTSWVVEVAYRTLVAPPGMAFALPALLWLGLVWLLAPECL